MAAQQSSFNESAVKQLLRSVVQEELSPVKNEMQLVKEEMQQIRKDMREYRDEVATMKDEIVGELQTTREESTIHKGQHDRFDDVEQRLEKLEEIHPKGRHASA